MQKKQQLQVATYQRKTNKKKDNIMSNFFYFLSTIFLIISCNCNKTAVESSGVKKIEPYFKMSKNNTIIYRFLYINNYGFEINEKNFWSIGKYESEFELRLSDRITVSEMINSIKTLVKVNDFAGGLTFSFVEKDTDTVYASYNLKNWIVKKEGISEFYKFPDTITNNTDTLFIKKLLKTESFVRDWNCYNK
jgi:hypothetical protein